MAAVHEVVLGNGCNYWRYMDDVMIVAATKGEAMAGIRRFERECRRWGLILSAHKTSLTTGGEGAKAGGDPDKDKAQYLLDSNQALKVKEEPRRILNEALKDEGNVDVSAATFSLWRLAQLMDKRPLRRVLKHLEDLGSLARISAAYLRKFIAEPKIEEALAEFLADPARNTSPVRESQFEGLPA